MSSFMAEKSMIFTREGDFSNHQNENRNREGDFRRGSSFFTDFTFSVFKNKL
jgi:hypothetical protein